MPDGGAASTRRVSHKRLHVCAATHLTDQVSDAVPIAATLCHEVLV